MSTSPPHDDGFDVDDVAEAVRRALANLRLNWHSAASSEATAAGTGLAAEPEGEPVSDSLATPPGGSTAAAPAQAQPSGPAASAAVSWCYVVWSAPQAPSLQGIHLGGGAAWVFITGVLGTYSYAAGHRLRRAPDLDTALVWHRAEAARHRAQLPPPLFCH